MKTEPAYDAVFQALVDIRKNLDEKISLLDEQIRRAQLECLDNAFQQQKEALVECLDGIDQQMITLSVYIEEYQHLRGSLRNVNEKIAELGGTPPVMPETIAGDSLGEVLAGRLDYLKSQGKIRDW
jgi:ACT domain-containing protein